MNRGRFTTMAVGVGIAGALGALGLERTRAEPEAARFPERPLPVPTEGFIRTAVAIGPGANVIDLSGPWEVFQDAAVAEGAAQSELYTVAEDMSPIDASGDLRIEPAYTYRTAPRPDALEASFPSIRVLRHRRFVEHEHVATAGGLSSGIDLALRVVERYLGRDAAAATPAYMEYERRSPAIA